MLGPDERTGNVEPVLRQELIEVVTLHPTGHIVLRANQLGVSIPNPLETRGNRRPPWARPSAPGAWALLLWIIGRLVRNKQT